MRRGFDIEIVRAGGFSRGRLCCFDVGSLFQVLLFRGYHVEVVGKENLLASLVKRMMVLKRVMFGLFESEDVFGRRRCLRGWNWRGSWRR